MLHIRAPSLLLGSTTASLLLRGTLNAPVTKRATMYNKPPESRQTAPGSFMRFKATMTRKTLAKPVPKNKREHNRLSTVMLIDCIAAIPCSAVRRERAFITNAEKANSTPATIPEPTAVIRDKIGRKSSIALYRIPYSSFGNVSRVVSEIPWLSAQGALNTICQV